MARLSFSSECPQHLELRRLIGLQVLAIALGFRMPKTILFHFFWIEGDGFFPS